MNFGLVIGVVRNFAFLACVLAAMLTHVPMLSAQTAGIQADGSVPQQGAGSGDAAPTSPLNDPSAWTRILDTTEQAISRVGVTDADLQRLLAETDQIQRSAGERIKLLRPQVERARQQLNELGPPPGENEPPETEAVKQRRAELDLNFSQVDSELKNASVTEVRSQQIRRTIADIQNRRFVQSISARSKGLTTAQFWTKFFEGFTGFGRSVYLLVTDSLAVLADKLASELRTQFLLVAGLGLITLIYIRLRRLLNTVGDYSSGVFGIRQAGKMPAAFVRFLRSGVVPAALVLSLYWLLSGLGLLTSRLDLLLQAMTAAIGFAIAVTALFRVYLSPADVSLRLANLSDAAASRIFSLLSGALTVAVLLVALKQVSKIVVAPIQVNIGLSLASALLVAVVALVVLAISRKDRHSDGSSSAFPPTMPRTLRYLYLALWPLAGVILLSALVGYVAFAEFLSEQLLFGSFVVLTAWLLLYFIDYVLLHLPVSAMAQDDIDGTPKAVSVTASGQLMILAAGLLKLSTYLLAALLLMLPWGYRTSDFFQFVNQAFFGFEVGGLSISLSTVLLAVLLFLIGYAVTTGLRNWLNNKYLPTTNLDIGISNSISTVFGYAGIILAGVMAVSAAGFDLSNLAIVAGALSVGVGFGLQSIVNNFVSGLILLAERPIKAGDWVSTSGGEGYVRKISVRSTEIETFDRATVIVPNSTLITDTVTNWTHGNKSGRIIVPIGVSYDSDPNQVRDILIECAKNHPLVMGRPEPVVFFMDFGASSLDFQLRCFLADINYGMSVKSELRFAILAALREAEIEIPFPQRDLNIKGDRILVSDLQTDEPRKT